MGSGVFALSAEIGCLVQNGKTLLQSQSSDIETCNATLREIVSLVPNSGLCSTTSSFASHVSESQTIFMENHYASFADYLLEHMKPNWLQPDEKGRRLIPLVDCYFLNGHQEDAYSVLSRAIGFMPPGLCLFHCISLLERLIKCGCLRVIFKMHCCDRPLATFHTDVPSKKGLSKVENFQLQQKQTLLNTIASLPDSVLANASVREIADFFYKDQYIAFICREICATLSVVHELILGESACSVLFLALVIGKLSLAGYGEVLWTYLLPELEPLCASDFVWQRIVQRMVADIPERSIETVVTQLAIQCSSYKFLAALLGSVPVQNKKMAYVMTHKVFLVRCYDEPVATRVLHNIIGYLAADDQQNSQLFLPAFRSLLTAWSDGSSLRHRPVMQSLYLCKAIVISLKLAPMKCFEIMRDDVVHHLLAGLPIYLGSSVTDVRHMGCFVAEKLSAAVHREKEGEPLHFQLEASDVLKSLSELSLHTEVTDTIISPVGNAKVNTSDLVSDNDRSSVKDKSVNFENSGKSEMVTDVDSDDSEDELTPYPIFPRKPINSKRPTYLAQCIEGLVQADDPDRVEQCLLNAELLVRNCNPTTAAEVSIELSRVLLHLEDRFALPDFNTLRFKSMVATVVVSPNSVAEFLAGEFYARNYSIRQRMDVLDVLAAAANELSEPVKSSQPSTAVTLQSPTTDHSAVHWSEIVRSRIEGKTRRFGRTGKPVPGVCSVNRFGSCAGSFFYPLMRYFDRQTDACIDLLGVDHLLYERLVYALGSIVLASRNLPCSRGMSTAMLEFIRCTWRHCEAGVRRAGLYAVCAALLALPSGSLIDDPSGMAELGDWLRMVSGLDSDAECQKRAVQGLIILEGIVQREMSAD